MTREQAKTLWPIIQAFGEGKEIQYRNAGRRWHNISHNTGFLEPYEWRIKPEPREFWLELHPESDLSCVQAVKCSQGNKPDDCLGKEIIKVREVLE